MKALPQRATQPRFVAQLDRAPGLKIVATSRQPLRLSGEQQYYVPAMDVPKADSTLEDVAESESVALYADRARLVRPDFTVTVSNHAAIAELCRRLEGMLLAIEIAAAWAKLLPPARVLDRLDSQLDMLIHRRHDMPARQPSMRATIEWSYALLAPALQRLFAWMSVFRGGWTIDEAEPVFAPSDRLPYSVLEGLMELQERSLIVASDEPDEPRFRMLEPLWEFCARTA